MKKRSEEKFRKTMSVQPFTLVLSNPVPPFLIADVQAKLAYLDRRVSDARLSADGQTIELVLTAPLDDAGSTSLRDLLSRMVREMTEDAFEPDLKILDEHLGAMPFAGDPMAALIEQREIFEEGAGFYAIGPLLSTIIESIDGRVRQIASEMGAQPYRFPALISPEYLEKVQYFKNFPHSLSFVTHLNENLLGIERFAAEACCEDGRVRVDRSLFADASAMLSPTVCHHLYSALAGREIAAPGIVATAAGDCFRFEARNMYSLERLWNFTMREIVFVGEDDFVIQGIDKVRRAFASVLREFDITHRVTTANDPFFVGTFRDQAAYQAAFELKHEIRADVPYRKSTVAIGSYNRHGTFFGRTLDIRNGDGSAACTGCFGLGFERVVFAFVAQHGPDPQNWPSAVRTLVEGVSR